MTAKINTKKSIVIVASSLHYPARRNGESLRYFTLICNLYKRGYLIDVIILNKYRVDYQSSEIQGLNNFCNKIDIIDTEYSENFIVKTLRRASNIVQLFKPYGKPYTYIDNSYKKSFEKIRGLIKNRDQYEIGIGVANGGCNAELLLSLDSDIRPKRIVCDFIDSSYLLRKRSYQDKEDSLAFLYNLETEKIKRWETSLCKRCTCIYISKTDAVSVGDPVAHVVPNCINDEGYSGSSPVRLQSPNIGFLGSMAYPPNIEACIYLTDKIFPLIKNRLPDVNLYIIGRYPGPELLSHCNDSQIHVTGEVDNIWDYIRAVDVFVFPMLSGAGLQNKVIEAMFAGKPVVTSPIGNEGIDAVHSKHLYIAKNEKEYAQYIVESFDNRKNTAKQARKYVREKFSESEFVDHFEEILLAEGR